MDSLVGEDVKVVVISLLSSFGAELVVSRPGLFIRSMRRNYHMALHADQLDVLAAQDEIVEYSPTVVGDVAFIRWAQEQYGNPFMPVASACCEHDVRRAAFGGTQDSAQQETWVLEKSATQVEMQLQASN